MTTTLMPQQPSPGGQNLAAPQSLPFTPLPIYTPPGRSIRHILLGPPAAVRQTIHLLHKPALRRNPLDPRTRHRDPTRHRPRPW